MNRLWIAFAGCMLLGNWAWAGSSEFRLAGGEALPRHNQGSPLGTNLNAIADWSTEWAFVDAFPMSRPWVSSSPSEWKDGRELSLDENGWVRKLERDQTARTLLFWDVEQYPAGRYLVLYDGEGTIRYSAGAKKNRSLSSPGRDVIDVDPERGGISINITSVGRDYLRNIRVIMPGGVCSNDPYAWCQSNRDCGATCVPFERNYRTQIFHPTFLDRIKRYRLLRYMDWLDTNDSTLKDWADRPKMTDAHWRRHGVPLEIMVELSNRLHADPWFCMPHLASDDFVSKFAEAVEKGLDPQLKAYVEYSNEIWNSMFDQSDYAKSEGLVQGLSSNPTQAKLFFQSKRSLRIFDLWQEAFGGTDRLVRVLASQSANPWTAKQLLSYGQASEQADALAIAPYFSWNAKRSDVAEIRSMSTDDLAAKIEEELLPRTIEQMRENKSVADEFGVELIAYEGGQHLVGVQGGENKSEINERFDAINRDPRMGAFYTHYLNAWKDIGGRVFTHYNNCSSWSKWGRWGALEYLSQPREEAPKYDALLTFIEQNAGNSAE